MAWYPYLKPLHVALALASGGLFTLRGVLRLCAVPWGNGAALRFTSVAIDTALLTAALTLVAILPRALFANGWLYAKLAWLAAYIVLGSLALKRARGQRARVLCFVASLAAFGQIYAIARSHQPLGAGWYLQQMLLH